MRIGMMTFHKATSHGAMLQAFALQQTLKNLGNEVEIINYDRCYLKNENAVSDRTIKTKIKRRAIMFISYVYSILDRKNTALKGSRFDAFRSNYLVIGEKEYRTSEELRNDKLEYDAYVVGSDQVWNPDSIIHDAFYFTFLSLSEKTIAYAPSIGVSRIDDTTIREKMKNYLQHVQFLSCREISGAKVIEDITNRHVEHVLDPTLLLRHEEWLELIPRRSVQKPYVLCYFLGSLKYGREHAKRIADNLGYDIIMIPQSPVDVFFHCKKARGVGPLEFLSLFEGASVICTDSFHGTAFSINFQKPFYSFCRRNPNGVSSRLSRLQDLLEVLGLSQRLIMPGDEITIDELFIDFDEVTKLLEEKRELSVTYLMHALNCDSQDRYSD